MAVEYKTDKQYYFGDLKCRYVGEISRVHYFQKEQDNLYLYLVQAEAEEMISESPSISDSSLGKGVDDDHNQPRGVTRPLGVTGLKGSDLPSPTPSLTPEESEELMLEELTK